MGGKGRKEALPAYPAPPAYVDPLEIELHAEFPESWLQHRGRRQPRGVRRTVVQVVSEDGRRIQNVVEVEPDVGPRSAESQNLGESDVELIHAVAIQSPRLDQVLGHA